MSVPQRGYATVVQARYLGPPRYLASCEQGSKQNTIERDTIDNILQINSISPKIVTQSSPIMHHTQLAKLYMRSYIIIMQKKVIISVKLFFLSFFLFCWHFFIPNLKKYFPTGNNFPILIKKSDVLSNRLSSNGIRSIAQRALRVRQLIILRHKADYEANVFELHSFLYRCNFFEDCFYII